MSEKTHFLYSTTFEPNDKPLLYKRLCTKKQENENENSAEMNDQHETFILLVYKKLMKPFN
jgi:hypothetical protein